MSEQPLVSIVTPSFNQGRFLPATLASIAAQDYPHIQHIVVDGGSTDGSVEILRNWSSHKLSWTSEPDGGQAEAIQRGFSAADGEILAWLNSDDLYLTPTVVSEAVAAMASGAGLVCGSGWYLNADGTPLRRIPYHPDWLDHATVRCVDWFPQPATFFRRDLAMQVPFDLSLHYVFDWDFFIRLTEITQPLAVDREWAGYRLHDSSKTISGSARRRREILREVARNHGRISLRYAAHVGVAAGYGFAEKLPGKWNARMEAQMGRIVRWSNRLNRGRGFQV